MNLMGMTAVELGKAIKDGQVSVVEATQACLDSIEACEKDYNSFVTVDREGALAQAEEVQKKIDAGELNGPLAGVPIAIKDNMCQEGVQTSCSSKILSNFVPTYTAEAVVKLKEAGAVIVGHTNMDEFAMGSTTETSYFGETRNQIEFQVVHQVDQRQQLPVRRCHVPSVQIPVDPSDSRLHSAVLPESSQPMEECQDTDL